MHPLAPPQGHWPSSGYLASNLTLLSYDRAPSLTCPCTSDCDFFNRNCLSSEYHIACQDIDLQAFELRVTQKQPEKKKIGCNRYLDAAVERIRAGANNRSQSTRQLSKSKESIVSGSGGLLVMLFLNRLRLNDLCWRC